MGGCRAGPDYRDMWQRCHVMQCKTFAVHDGAQPSVIDTRANCCLFMLPVNGHRRVEMFKRDERLSRIGNRVERMPRAQHSELLRSRDKRLQLVERLWVMHIFRAVFEVACPVFS